jgi:hypothetical protein
VESSCEIGNKPSGSIKCWESTEWLHNLWPLEWYSAPQSYLVMYKYICEITYVYNPTCTYTQVHIYVGVNDFVHSSNYSTHQRIIARACTHECIYGRLVFPVDVSDAYMFKYS